MRPFILLAALLFTLPAFAADAPKQSAFDHVISSGTLRCGYFVYPPYSKKDLVTGKMSGVYPEIFEEIAKQAGLKIDWVEEVATDTMYTGLQNGRYDALCTPNTYTVARAKQALFTTPFVYVPFYVYVQARDMRFDEGDTYAKLNQPDVKFVTMDGDLIEELVKQTFPVAGTLSFGGMTDAAQLYLSVSSGKATAIIGEPVYAGIFMANNPGQIKQIKSTPVKVISATAAVGMGEHNLLAFLNTAFASLAETGFIDKVLQANIPNSEDLLKAQKPYQLP